jgi:hypothetical protein
MTSADEPAAHDLPPAQYLAPEVVLLEMAEAGAKRSMSLSGWQVLIAGGFITIGALFSTLIATGTDNEGVQRLLEGSASRPASSSSSSAARCYSPKSTSNSPQHSSAATRQRSAH